MIKKALTAAGIAGALIFAGSSAALADEYPVDTSCSASPATVAAGADSTITCEGLTPGGVEFTATGPGISDGDLASIVLASADGSTSVVKEADTDGTASASLTVPGAGEFVVSVEDSEGNTASTTVTVTAAAGGDSGELPVTGGGMSTAALWLGVGAVGLGGIAVAAAVARRRAAQQD
jgi:hypothetical protein